MKIFEKYFYALQIVEKSLFHARVTSILRHHGRINEAFCLLEVFSVIYLTGILGR